MRQAQCRMEQTEIVLSHGANRNSRYDDSDPLNFAYEWQQWELKYDTCPLDMRDKWPAFSATGNAVSITSGEASHMHKELLTVAIGADLAAPRTLHAYRATLASKFAAARAAGIPVSDGSNQPDTLFHLRWKTLAALQSYVKLTPQAFADNTALAARMDAGPHLSRDLPEYEPHNTVFDIEQSLEIMSLRGDAPPNDSARAVAEALQSAAQPIVKPKAQKSLLLTVHESGHTRREVTICGSETPVLTYWDPTHGASLASILTCRMRRGTKRTVALLGVEWKLSWENTPFQMDRQRSHTRSLSMATTSCTQ